MDAMQAAAGPEPILNVLPFRAKKFAVIPTGSEVFKGRIEDKFTPILQNKLAEYGCEMTFRKVCDDDPAGITAAILEAKDAGCELIFTTGGMSVDPDDRTPLAIKKHRCRHHQLRRAGAAGCHVPGQLSGRGTRVRPARLCDVRQANDF